MFGKKKAKTPGYDPNEVVPVLHRSICTGETTAGFRQLKSGGAFLEVMAIRNPRDLKAFMDTYGIEETPKTEY